MPGAGIRSTLCPAHALSSTARSGARCGGRQWLGPCPWCAGFGPRRDRGGRPGTLRASHRASPCARAGVRRAQRPGDGRSCGEGRRGPRRSSAERSAWTAMISAVRFARRSSMRALTPANWAESSPPSETATATMVPMMALVSVLMGCTVSPAGGGRQHHGREGGRPTSAVWSAVGSPRRRFPFVGAKKNGSRSKPGAVPMHAVVRVVGRSCYERRRSHAPRPASRRPGMPMPTRGTAGVGVGIMPLSVPLRASPASSTMPFTVAPRSS